MKNLLLALLLFLSFQSFAQTPTEPDFIKTDNDLVLNYFPEINLDIENLIDLENYNSEYNKIKESSSNEEVLAFLNERKHFKIYNYNIEAVKAGLYWSENDLKNTVICLEKAINSDAPSTLKSHFYYMLSVLKNNQNDFKGTLEFAIKSFELDPLNYNKAIFIANLYSSINEIDNCILYYLKVLTIKPKYNNYRNKVGCMYQEINKHDLAIAEFNKIIKIEPESAYAYNNRGYSYLKKNDLEKAMADVNKSISLNDKNSYAFRNKALIYIAMKKNTLACEAINQAIALGYITKYGSNILMEKGMYCE